MDGMRLPSRFQIGDQVRVGAERGAVVGVTFALVPIDPESMRGVADVLGYTGPLPDEAAKIMYDVRLRSGVRQRIYSDDVLPGMAAVG
jgi:hypothetical protein